MSKTFGRYVVMVRQWDDGFICLGVFSTAEAAKRKADAINKRLEAGQDEEEIAWAYPMQLDAAARRADDLAKDALGIPR